ncbi:MAG TPA: hypothetical protein VFB67_10440 [Candidatus Polarisedimenticolaceae bacterium]|nr:hypothetical protein [Candidatus Polarisedimenticolaceae bacterium]
MPAAGDTVVRRDGSRFEGTVASVDAAAVVLDTPSGTLRIPRHDVASISFNEIKPLKVEIRNVKSDDALDVLVDGEEVIRDARDGGAWIDLTPRLKDGNTPVRLRVKNQRATWAYQLHFRINGEIVPVGCGTPFAAGAGCTCCGKTGKEVGTIEDLPEFWIHVDRALGRAEILP